MIVYLHGFNSSPQSLKARLVEARMADLDLLDQLACPALPHSPKEAIASIDVLLPADASGVTFIGSSLGGFYATHLAEKHGARAVLVNPAVQPHVLLAPFVGEQQNLHSGKKWALTPAHIAELAALEVEPVTRPERYLLLVEPDYEGAGAAQRARMDAHGYIRGIPAALAAAPGRVLARAPLGLDMNPLNAATVTLFEKATATAAPPSVTVAL